MPCSPGYTGCGSYAVISGVRHNAPGGCVRQILTHVHSIVATPKGGDCMGGVLPQLAVYLDSSHTF